VLIQREVGDQLLELEVLFFELSEAAEFCDTHASKLLLPAVEGLFSDTEVAADFKDGCARFDLAERIGYLLFSELGFFQWPRISIKSLSSNCRARLEQHY
jgi:hypothetical protein